MEIREKTIFEYNGKEFAMYSEAVAYKKLCDAVFDIMAALSPRVEAVDDGLLALEHPIGLVEACRQQFLELCALTIPSFKRWFYEVAAGKRHESHIERILSDYSCEYPILNKTWFRFKCINRDFGYEFQQPYYVAHVEEAFEDIRKRMENKRKQQNNERL